MVGTFWMWVAIISLLFLAAILFLLIYVRRERKRTQEIDTVIEYRTTIDREERAALLRNLAQADHVLRALERYRGHRFVSDDDEP